MTIFSKLNNYSASERILPWLLAVQLGLCAAAWAGNASLRIEASNPADYEQAISIKTHLPSGIRSNDILNCDGLDLGYDIKSGVLYVHKQIVMPPLAKKIFEVTMNDIWQIPETTLADLEKHSSTLFGKLRRTESRKKGAILDEKIRQAIARIRNNQTENDVSRVDIVRHIAAHSVNTAILGKTRKSVLDLENLLISAREDPGKLLGESEEPLSHGVTPSAVATGKAVIRICVSNSSPTEARKLPLKYDLPAEINAADVLDPAGCQVLLDFEKGTCCLDRKDIEVPAGGTVTLDVTIRDKWNINAERIKLLHADIAGWLDKPDRWRNFKSIDSELRFLLAELDSISSVPAPRNVNEEYVAFFDDQTRKLDRIEKKFNRIKTAPFRSGLTDIPPPTWETTWIIIYCILGFLAVISLIVAIRHARK